MSNDRVRIERRYAHPIERVWRAVTEPGEMDKWFVVRPDWTPELSETWHAMGHDGRITELEAPRVFAWEWGIERYRFELEPDGDGTHLVFTHVFNPEIGPAEQHERGWTAYFARLEAHLEGGHLTEEQAHALL